MYTVPKGTVPNKETIAEAIELNEKKRPYYDILDEYYKGIHSIFSRIKVGPLKNNRVVINYPKYISKMTVGYLLGNPVEYQVNADGIDIDPILNEYSKQNIAYQDLLLAIDGSKFGTAYEYTYTVENSLKSRLIDVRNCIIVYDDTLDHNKLFAILYSAKQRGPKYVNVSVVTDKVTQKWDEKLEGVTLETPHAFGVVNVLEMWNNEDRSGDYEDVISLIDAYNLLQSDRINDKEQLVEAILMLYGIDLTPQQKEDLKTHRSMSAPMDARAEYLIKQLDEQSIDVLRQNIESDIHKISMTPNMSDDNFVGNSSGVAIKYKLLPFEQHVKNKEMFMTKTLKERMQLYSNYLAAIQQGEKIDISKVECKFKRNLPQNDLETAQMISLLRGIASDETLLAELSFVENSEDEVKWAAEETLDRMNVAGNGFGNQPTDNNQGGAQ